MVPSDEKGAFKFAQLYVAIRGRCNIKIIEKIVEQQDDINFTFPTDSLYRNSIFYLKGCSTALHLAYCVLHDIDFLVFMLNRGANFTQKNEYGQTVLHMRIENYIETDIRKPLNDRFINAVLLGHITHKNFSNPRNSNGLSHFHIACMTNNLTAVQFFLDNGVSVDEPTTVNSENTSGYTPLHFAAMYANTKVAEILLMHGANMHITEASGMTPLHLLIKYKLEMLDFMRITETTQNYEADLQEVIGENDKFINMLLENTSTDNYCPDSIGLTNFHIACTLQDASVAQNLVDRVTDLDQMVNMDSHLWPGYTALHFAAHVSLDTVIMLINKGASTEAKDLKGITFLDICVERCSIKDICRIISLKENWKDLIFSDCKTKLLSVIRSMDFQYKFEGMLKSLNINMHIPMESPLWPGYTPLHLAVLFAESPNENTSRVYGDWRDVNLTMIKLCFKYGANLSFQDNRGQTALHLAFRLNYTAAVDIILRRCLDIPNLSDKDHLSHLHIVCAVGKQKRLLKKCVLNHSVVNAAYRGDSPINAVRPGWTPLHAILVNSHTKHFYDMIKILLSSGADFRIKDAYGLTPIHWLLQGWSNYCEELLDQVTNECVVEDYGISYLHVAAYMKNHELAKRLLENGADVNLAIKRSGNDQLSFLYTYETYTPLHFTSFRDETSLLLVDYGADVFAEKADGFIPLTDEDILEHFVWKLRNDADLQKRMERKFGWTRLHLACHSSEADGFQDIVKAESKNMNAQVFSTSTIWKGYTPLHVLMDRAKNRCPALLKNFEHMLTLLLENGADVTVVDEKQVSPIAMLLDFSDSNEEHALSFREEMALLMKHHKDFSINPTNAQGVSHFHLACYLNDVVAVEGFLSLGANINQPIGFFADWCPGYTPLHLASQLRLVDLLISRGADVQIENVRGRTALEKTVQCRVFDESIVTRMIEAGADPNKPNSRGETAFEVAISSVPITMEKLVFCIKQGFLVNSCNPLSGVSYLTKIVETYYEDQTLQMLIVEKIMNEPPSNTLGRTSLHYLVTSSPFIFPSYFDVLEKLIKSSQDIDQQDNKGKTALHLAAEFGNIDAVITLLNYGADINVCDTNGNSALCDPTVRDSSVKKILIIHACRLSSLGLDLSKNNVDVISNARENTHRLTSTTDFYKQITASKDIKLGVRSIRLYDFLSETGAIALYPFLNELERCKIEQYFESIGNDASWDKVKCFLMLQYRRAIKRLELFPMATNSFRLLLGFDLPVLCVENIFKYLSNSGLQSIISTEIGNEDMGMDVD